jgi:hypothetical protein
VAGLRTSCGDDTVQKAAVKTRAGFWRFLRMGVCQVGTIRYLALGAVAAFASVAAMSAAKAAVLVEVWGGFGNNASLGTVTPDQAENPTPSPDPVAEFVYNGPVNWVNNNANNGTDNTQNLFGQFFTAADISLFTSPGGEYSGASGLTNFLNTSMSSEGNSWFSYIQVLGIAQGAASVTVSHDDGASAYDASCPGGVCFSQPGQTSLETSPSFMVNAGDLVTIDYIEANGSPSDLVVNSAATFSAPSVPEPSTWAMLLVGFAGLGFGAFRRSRKGDISIVSA